VRRRFPRRPPQAENAQSEQRWPDRIEGGRQEVDDDLLGEREESTTIALRPLFCDERDGRAAARKAAGSSFSISPCDGVEPVNTIP